MQQEKKSRKSSFQNALRSNIGSERLSVVNAKKKKVYTDQERKAAIAIQVNISSISTNSILQLKFEFFLGITYFILLLKLFI